MPVIGAGPTTATELIDAVKRALINHRESLQTLGDLHDWSSGISLSDLTSAPVNMSSTDAQAILTAINDAHAEYLIHTTGLPPNTYPQPASAYIYEASQNAVIGFT